MRLEEETQRRDYELAKLNTKLSEHIEEFQEEFPDEDSRGLLSSLLEMKSKALKVKI